jgi:hypothetical protein
MPTFVVHRIMLKRALLLFLVTSGCFRAQAQEGYYIPEPKIFNGGVILGANFTQVDGDSFYGYHKIGLNAGGIVNVHFSNNVGVSIEMLYSQKGSRGVAVYESPAIGTYIEKYNMTLNYVEVPIMLHIFQGRFDYEAGASAAYLVKATEWVQADQPVVIDPVANRFNKSDVDVVVGASRRMYKQLYLNFRFEYSITSIRPADRIPVGYGYGAGGQYNNLVNLRLVYYL